jgi:uncharacterized membrane protein
VVHHAAARDRRLSEETLRVHAREAEVAKANAEMLTKHLQHAKDEAPLPARSGHVVSFLIVIVFIVLSMMIMIVIVITLLFQAIYSLFACASTGGVGGPAPPTGGPSAFQRRIGSVVLFARLLVCWVVCLHAERALETKARGLHRPWRAAG